MTEAPPSNAESPAAAAVRTRSRAFYAAALVGLWAAATVALHLISKSEWWLCALGGLGAVLVIWPGPKSTPHKG